jgi:hypothetical protein
MEELFLNIDTGKQIIFINVSENYTICFLDLDVCCHCMCILGNCGLMPMVQFCIMVSAESAVVCCNMWDVHCII